jgi:hypothetical protein
MIAGVVPAFGLNNFSIMLPSLLMGLGTVLFVYLITGTSSRACGSVPAAAVAVVGLGLGVGSPHSSSSTSARGGRRFQTS